MPTKRVEPWFTEEYVREREAEIDARIAAGLDPWEPWTEDKAEKLRKEIHKEIKESEIKFRRETLKSIERLGAEGFVMQTIEELKAEIFKLQNPTQDDLYKYTDAYFKDHIKIYEYILIFFESLLKDKEKLKKTFEAYTKKLQQLEEEENGLFENAFNFIEFGRYMKLPQDNHTNHLAHKLTTKIKDRAQLDLIGKDSAQLNLAGKDRAQLDLTGKATITSQDFRLYIEGYDKLVNGANTSAVKLFDAAVINCSKNRDPLARIPLKEYMELRGLKNEKEARKQIKADMEVLKSVKFEYKGRGKGRGDWLSLSLYGGRAGIYKGVIEFRFTPEFYASIPKNQFMFIPKEYFSTHDKYNPHTAYFIRRIAEHKRMNLGKLNENIIGVETLVNSSPTFPKYDETKGYHFSQLILRPFERDMNAIKSIKWHYAGEQPTNYNEFITSNVVITWVDYPEDEVKKLTQQKKNSVKEKKTQKKGVAV